MLTEDTTPQKKDDFVDNFVKSPVFVVSYIAISLLCGVLAYWVSSIIPMRHVLFGFGIGLALIVTIILTTAFINRLRSQEMMDDKYDKLNKLLASNNLNWIVNQQHIKSIEVQSNETWTFATELTYALQPDSDIYAGTKRNLARGARYKFFMPDRPRVHKIVSDYKRLYKFEPGQVEFILIPPSEFLFHTIMSVYNVHTDTPRCIEWLPIRKLNVWIEMDEEHAQKMAGIGEVLIRKYADRYTAPSADIQKDGDILSS